MPMLAESGDSGAVGILEQVGQWADRLAMPAVAVNARGDILYANAELQQVTGRTQDDLEGQPVAVLLHELSDGALRDALASVSACGHGLWTDVLLREADGGYVGCRAAVSQMVTTAVEAVFVIVFVQDEISRLALVLERSSEGLLVLDAKGRVLYANAAGADLVGHARRELTGRFITEVFPECADLLQASGAGQEERLLSVKGVDGLVRWVSTRAVALAGRGLAECGWAVLLTDATDRMLLEMLRRAVSRLGRGLSPESTVGSALSVLTDGVGLDSASVWLLEPERHSLRGVCRVRSGGVCEDISDATVPEWLDEAVRPLVGGHLQYVCRNLPGWKQDSAVVPLVANERFIGVIAVETSGGQPVLDEHMLWLKAVARLVASALDYDAVTRRVQEALKMAELAVESGKAAATLDPRTVWRVLWSYAQELLSIQRLVVWLLEPASGRLKMEFAADTTPRRNSRPRKIERERAEQALVAKRPVLSDEGGRVLAALPMTSETEVFGVLCASLERGRGLSEGDGLLLDLLTACTTVPLVLARAIEGRREAARRELFAQFVRTVNHHVNNCLQAMIVNAQLLAKCHLESSPRCAARLNALLEACYRLADFTERLRRTTSITPVETAGGEVLELAPSEDGRG